MRVERGAAHLRRLEPCAQPWRAHGGVSNFVDAEHACPPYPLEQRAEAQRAVPLGHRAEEPRQRPLLRLPELRHLVVQLHPLAQRRRRRGRRRKWQPLQQEPLEPIKRVGPLSSLCTPGPKLAAAAAAVAAVRLRGARHRHVLARRIDAGGSEASHRLQKLAIRRAFRGGRGSRRRGRGVAPEQPLHRRVAERGARAARQ